MENEIVIDVRNIEKQFRVYKDKGYTLKSKILFSKRRAFEERKVLRGISFQVHRGEAIGLIGHNGCGKSTTLKLLTRIIYPDKGTITMKGRVSSLIELGAGFHPDMSGRENIYINASIFGLTREEIDRRLGDIIEFSELGEFIDNPVRTYSSGMYMRLAFSVAINVDADILLVDEILSVGDAAFQAKCFNKLREIKAKGTTIVVVSHALGQIEQICDRSIWIHQGKVRMEGKPRDVHPTYLDYVARHSGNVINPDAEETKSNPAQEQQPEGETAQATTVEAPEQVLSEETISQDKNRWGNGDARFQAVSLLDKNGNKQIDFCTGDSIAIKMDYQIYRTIQSPVFGIGIFRNDDLQCYGTNTQLDREEHLQVYSKGSTLCQISRNVLLPGEYTLDVAVHDENGFAYDYWRKAVSFTVHSDVSDVGVARLEHSWKFINAEN